MRLICALAVATGQPLSELIEADDVTIATLVTVLEERSE